MGNNLIIQPSLPLFAKPNRESEPKAVIPACGPKLQSVAPVKAPIGSGTEGVVCSHAKFDFVLNFFVQLLCFNGTEVGSFVP